MRNFLVTEEADFEANFEAMCEQFIIETFGEDKLNNGISVSVNYWDKDMFTRNYTQSILVEIVFYSYKWVNGLNEERNETIGVCFENKNLQPFYIDGKFKTMEVYQCVSCHPLQKHDNVYGFEKEVIQNMFYDYITTC